MGFRGLRGTSNKFKQTENVREAQEKLSVKTQASRARALIARNKGSTSTIRVVPEQNEGLEAGVILLFT